MMLDLQNITYYEQHFVMIMTDMLQTRQLMLDLRHSSYLAVAMKLDKYHLQQIRHYNN